MAHVLRVFISSIVGFNLLCFSVGCLTTPFCADYASVAPNSEEFVLDRLTTAGRAADPSVGIPQ
jgi:hypothetical protein